MTEVSYPAKVLPGQPILPIYQPTDTSKSIKYIAGENVRLETIQFNNQKIPTLVSTALGRVEITDNINNNSISNTEGTEEKKIDDKNAKIVSVISKKDFRYNTGNDNQQYDASCKNFKAVTPKVNDIVLARITKLSHVRINVEILSVLPENSQDNGNIDNLQLLNLLPSETGEFFKATIRSQDVRSTERENVKTWECYQPGDIIRAVVLSLGDGVTFYLSTARNDLGVVFARNDNGELLYPLDWETMVAPSTGEVFKRKCAKPF